MKQLAFSLISLSFAASVWAQAPKEPAKPAAPEATKEAEPPKKQAAATPRGKPRRWNEDARHCLERPTNTEIIKCAEEYL